MPPRVTRAERKLAADVAADRIRRLGPTAVLPVLGDPPPPLREGDGEGEWHLDGPGHTVFLDEPGFIALWRYVEAHALKLHNNPSPHAREPERTFLRAVASFREASGQDLTPKPAHTARKVWSR